VQGDQRRRAGGLDGNGRPFEVELVGHARGGIVLVGADDEGKQIPGFHEARLRGQVEQVTVHAGAGVDAGGFGQCIQGNGGVFDRLHGALQKYSLLRIDPHRLVGVVAEKARVKSVEIVEHGCRWHVVRGTVNVFGEAP